MHNSSPRFSIILPAYNAERWIREAILSVVNQSFVDWELILINDGSGDRTLELAEGIADPRIHIFTQRHSGVGAARNLGLSSARGEYFTFLDSDDLLTTNALGSYNDFVSRHPEADIVSGCVELRRRGTRPPYPLWKPTFDGDPTRSLARLCASTFFGICLLVRRRPGEKYLFPEQLTHCEDLVFFFQLAVRNKLRFCSMADTTYVWRETPGSAMSNLHGLDRGYKEFCKVVFATDDQRISRFDKYLLKAKCVRTMFMSYLRNGNITEAASSLLYTFQSPTAPQIPPKAER